MSTPTLTATRSAAPDYVELTKPRITLMVGVTASVGFVGIVRFRLNILESGIYPKHFLPKAKEMRRVET